MNNEPSFGSQSNDTPNPQFPQSPVPPVAVAPLPTNITPPNGTESPKKVLGILSLVFGILAVLSGLFFMGIVFGIGAVILGMMTLVKKKPGKKFAIAGIITGIIGFIAGVVFTIITIVALMGGGFFTTAPLEKADYEIAAEKQAVIDAKFVAQKKDFSVGETAQFGDFEVKANTVKDNFTIKQPVRSDYTNAFSYNSDLIDSNPGKGEKFVSVNVTVTNKSSVAEELRYIPLASSNGTGEEYQNLLLSLGGFGNALLTEASRPVLQGNESLEPGQSLTGNMVFSVPADAAGMKLIYTIQVRDVATQRSTNLKYSLALQ